MSSHRDPIFQKEELLDRGGAVASSACALHCMTCALLPGALAALGLGALIGHEAEWLFTLVALAFAAIALVVGWRMHQSGQVALLLGFGMIGLLGARFSEEAGAGAFGVALGVAAAVLLVAGHLSNIRAARECRLARTE